MPTKQDLYLPILVGAQKNFRDGIEFQRDDIGDNISQKNPNYNELTAIYWAWKNLKNVDAIGLVHYRRYFYTGHGKLTLDNVLSKKDVSKIFQEYDAILPKKRRYYIESNYAHYIHAHHKDPIDQLRRVISLNYPEYLISFDKVMSRRSAHMFNMFVMKKPLFDSYAEWLFTVLGMVEASIDISNYDVQEARVYGYLSELLMDVWINKNNIHYKEIRWGQIGNKQIVRKAFYLILRKFGLGGKQTHF